MKRSITLRLESLEARAVPVVGAAPLINGASPAAPEVTPGSFFDGIVQTIIGEDGGKGTGGLFTRNKGQGYGHHVVTVAHAVPVGNILNLKFELARNGLKVDVPITVPASADYQIKHPLSKVMDGDPYDVAILKLVDQDQTTQTPNRLLVSPFTARKYEFSVPGTVIGGRTAEFAGYGQTGQGTTGAAGGVGVKHRGKNTIDQEQDTFLLYDFDDGTTSMSKMGYSGLGENLEAIGAAGDSGSPVFVDNKIVGIFADVSYTDANHKSRFGDVAFSVRVTAFNDELLVPIDKAGNYDLVFDMEQQIYGRSGAGGANDKTADDLTITVSNVNGMLQIPA